MLKRGWWGVCTALCSSAIKPHIKMFKTLRARHCRALLSFAGRIDHHALRLTVASRELDQMLTFMKRNAILF